MYKNSYVGDGNTCSFCFVFPFFQTADIRVSLNDAMVDASHYCVTPYEDFSGGLVVLDEAPSINDRIDIFRKICLSRPIDYQPTQKIDPEHLNNDFKFLLAAIQDMNSLEYNLAEWENAYLNMRTTFENINTMISDKLSGGGALGVYNNLISVLSDALPKLINDYGYITDIAPNENNDDYGLL